MAFNTGNPLGSTDPRDLSDNSENLDRGTNGTATTFTDRLGVSRKSWKGMEAEFDADQATRSSDFATAQSDRTTQFQASQDDRDGEFNAYLVSAGYQFAGDYAAGIEITQYNQVVRDTSGEFWRASGSTALPYTTTGAGLPEGGAFVAVGDATLRNELAQAVSTGGGANLVSGATIYVGSVAELEALSATSDQQVLVGGCPFKYNGTVWVPLAHVTPEIYGAVGDGVTDDTVAIQATLDGAGEGGEILFKPDAVYRVNPNYQPVFSNYGGVKPSRGQTIRLQGAQIKALASSGAESSVLTMYNIDDVRMVGPGTISGERDIHTGTTGEFGHGISIWSSKNIKVKDLAVNNCWGDCIYIGHSFNVTPAPYAEDIVIDNCIISNGRRQGISVVKGNRIWITDNNIFNINGTSPEGGIDLEPDTAVYPNLNIKVLNNVMEDVAVGVYVVVANTNVLISGNTLVGRNAGIIIGDNTKQLSITDNPRLESGATAEGAAIRMTANDYTTIEDTAIRGNTLINGDNFCLDFPVGGYNRAVVDDNRIFASTAGVRLVRMVGGTFTNNQGYLDANAGVADGRFIQLDTVRWGGNSYNNNTAKNMYSFLPNGYSVLEDDYVSSSLRFGALNGPSGLNPRFDEVKAGTGESGGGIAQGISFTASVNGFDATKYILVLNAIGGGENSAEPDVLVGAITKTTTGFSVPITNVGGATQTISFNWVAVLI